MLIFVLVVLLLAVVTEVVQLWMPARAFNPVDLVANLAGLAAGVAGILIEDQRTKLACR